jgi:hypothetical protein
MKTRRNKAAKTIHHPVRLPLGDGLVRPGQAGGDHRGMARTAGRIRIHLTGRSARRREI